MEQEFLNLLHRTGGLDVADCIMMTAIMASTCGMKGTAFCGYPQEVYERAVQKLKGAQKDAPQFAAGYQKAIDFLEDAWTEAQQTEQAEQAANNDADAAEYMRGR